MLAARYLASVLVPLRVPRLPMPVVVPIRVLLPVSVCAVPPRWCRFFDVWEDKMRSWKRS